ncbi:MAG: FkbM family methyltransferase [Flavobacteriaceae bacterium]|nr:FkbM family methyltransferase [Flavobacteriaceae bacterium]
MTGEHTQWNLENGDHTHRVRYKLTENSTVLDVGGFRGEWASDIFSRYMCNILVFEPVREFHEYLQQKFELNPKIRVFPYGLGKKTETVDMYINNDCSSVYTGMTATNTEKVSIVGIADWFRDTNVEHVDLMKLNIEGAEFALMQEMFRHGLHLRVSNIQVQFHGFVPDSTKFRNAIHAELWKTHHPTYNFPFIWENWEINT